MNLMEWLVVLVSGTFFLLVLFALLSFVVRLFRETQPQKRKR